MFLYLRRYSRKHICFIQSVYIQMNNGLIRNNSVIDGNLF
jgi:hypothetical protein